MAQPRNRCAVAFSVSCERWKSPALLHAKRELLPRAWWLQGHVMVFTSYQSTHPAQVGCFATLSGHMRFLQKHLVWQQHSGLSVVENWDPSPQNRERCHICITFHPPVLLGKHLCFAQDRWHLIWDTQSQWHKDTRALSLWARWSLRPYPTSTILWFQVPLKFWSTVLVANQNNISWSAKSEDRTESEHRIKEDKDSLCANKKSEISRTDTISFSAVDLSIYISKTSSKTGAKDPMKCRLKIWCVGAAGRAHFTMGSVQGSATATVTNPGLRKRQAPIPHW